MLATFAFDVCHDVYRAAREVIDTKIPTLNLESSGKYTWHPDRMPRLGEYVCDFAMAGERALGGGIGSGKKLGRLGEVGKRMTAEWQPRKTGERREGKQAEACSTGGFSASASQTQVRASRMAMFRVYYLGGAEYHAARRHLGISEVTWADWAEEIRTCVGRELTRAGVFPPSKYFKETSAQAS